MSTDDEKLDPEPVRLEAMRRLGQAVAFLDDLYSGWLDGVLTDAQNEALTKVRDQVVAATLALGEIKLS